MKETKSRNKRQKYKQKRIFLKILKEVEKFKQSAQKTISWSSVKKDRKGYFVVLFENGFNVKAVVTATTLIELYSKLNNLGYKVV